MSYIGDFNAGSVVRFLFNTRKADGTPITLAGTPAISVYKNASTTQSTAGVTLTVGFDSVTGMHLVEIDTSQDGTFYAAASDFNVVITTGTVDSVSVVGAKVGSFSIANRGNVVVGSLANNAITTNAFNDGAITAAKIADDAITAAKIANGAIDSSTFATAAITSSVFSAGAINADAIAPDSLNNKGNWLTTLGTNAPAGWVNAAAIAASALNGKGDWLLSSGYTAPANADIAAIKVKTDGLNFTGTDVKATLDSEAVTVTSIGNNVITAASIAASALNGKGDWLTTLGTNAPSGWINAAAIAATALNGKGDWLTTLGTNAPAGWINAAAVGEAALNGKGDWLTSLGATAPAGWINADAIVAGAFDGKGDWLLDSSYDALTAQEVWEYTTRVLTSAGAGGATAQEVWEYATRTLTSAGAGGATAQEVWEYVTRTLTGSGILISI